MRPHGYALAKMHTDAPAPIPARMAHGKTRPPIGARAQKNPHNGGQFLGFHVPKIKNEGKTDSARH